MTDPATAGDAPDDSDGDGAAQDTGAGPDYGDMLDTLDVAIAEAARKVESGRVYDNENERTRIKWVRALAYTVNVRRQVANDRELEELTERLEELEGQGGPRP